MSAIDTRGVVSYPRPSWSTDARVSESPYRRLMDPHRHLPSSPLSSGHSSPEGSGEVSKLRTRTRSLSPQSRHLTSLHSIGHVPLLTSHTAGESESGSRKSSVEADAHNLDCAMTMDGTSRQSHLERLNGWSGGSGVGDWRDEREGLLMEIQACQRRILAISQEALEWELNKQNYEQKIQRLQKQLRDANTTRAACDKLKLQKWNRKKAPVVDLRGPAAPHEHMDNPQEIMLAFLESERQYMNNLAVLDSQYQQPMKMLSAFKPDVLSLQQLQFLFLNCSELLNLHRCLYEELSRVIFLPYSIQLDQFFATLERTFPNFSLYNPFMDNSRPQNIQKELRGLKQKQEFVQLLEHCNKGCEGADLEQLLTLPCERLNDYSTLLTIFLSPKLRDIADKSVRRADTLIRFIRSMKYELQDERSDWDYTQEKIKLLQKLDPDFPIPLEIFDSDTRLIKQGQLNQVMAGGKEVPRFCFLFSNYMALAEADKYLRILEHGMIPLCGAQLHKTVDIEGQPLTADLKSGRLEDRLAFRVSFVNNESIYFRVAKPSLWKAWTEVLEKCIQDSHQNLECEAEDLPLTQLYPDVGPKIAAASLEKLFQQLTSPHNFQDDFMEVFLMTHLSFATSRDVLEALINCMQSPRALPDVPPNAIFTFMEPDTVDPERILSTNQYFDADQYSLNSPIPARARTCAMSSGTPKSSAMRASISTSDSDISPHTSTVVENGILRNGWANADITLKTPPCNKRGSSGDSEADYVMFFRSSRNSSEMDFGDNEDSGNEDNADTPRPSMSDIQKAETGIEEALHGGEKKDDDSEGDVETMSRSQKMNRDLDETSLMLEQLAKSLFPVRDQEKSIPSSGANDLDECGAVVGPLEMPEDSTAVINRRCGDWQNPRKSTMSASISEPDLTVIGVMQSAKSGRTETSIPVPVSSEHRPGTPTHKLTNSLGPSQTYSASPFLHGKAMMSPAHKRGLIMNGGSSMNSSEDRFSLSGKQKKIEKGVMSHLKKRGSVKNDNAKMEASKKSDAPSTPVRVGNKMAPLTKSSSSYFTNSPEGGSKSQKSKSGVSSGFRSIWKRGSRKKAALKMDADDCVDGTGSGEQSPAHEITRRLSLKRKNSVMTDKLEPLTEQSKSPTFPRRAGSATRSGPVSLVTKIFQVLDYWQDVHFEDFGEDGGLTQMLENFLREMLARSCSDSKEALLGQKLLDDVTRKASHYSTDCSFAALLTRTYHLDPDLVKHFTWNSTIERQPGCRDIDLSKSFSNTKDNMLRVIAEQLTLMEFAVYKAVKRRELLNVNWKTPNREDSAPNVCRLIRRTNEMTSWVCTEILVRDTPSSRAMVIVNFIQIALYCYRHNDFHCSLNIAIALSSSIIRGLHKTWEEVDKKCRDKFKKLRELTDYQGRCKKLRHRLEQMTMDQLQKTGEIPSALPYIGAYLDQIYSLEMCTKTYNKDGLVNFTKMTKLAEMVGRTLVYQQSRFKFEPRLDIIAYLTSAKRLAENELYDLSCQIEPTSK